MNYDMECPYCGAELEVCHDGGFGYEENTLHEDECTKCGKSFVFTTSITTSISFYYEARKANCLNGEPHKYKRQCCIPRWCAKMVCVDCGDTQKIHNTRNFSNEDFCDKEEFDVKEVDGKFFAVKRG